MEARPAKEVRALEDGRDVFWWGEDSADLDDEDVVEECRV
jgi:hypothetical protein